jgi:very-short-patch-repair endonuclease
LARTAVKPPKRALSPRTLGLARHLRKNATDAEALIWSLLRDRRFEGKKFRRQVAMGPYVLDFYCHEARLCIELDGSGHMDESRSQHDENRTEYLEAADIRVLRFWNNDVLQRTEAVLETIWEAL